MIFNTDETGCSTVLALPKIIAEKGSKQIGQVTSAVRGMLVTTLFHVCCKWYYTSIFPRVNYKDLMFSNGPSGALGSAHVSDWMTENNFVEAMEHFISHVKPSEKIQPYLYWITKPPISIFV
ncbi:hypothetical protein JTB14_033893 [Gonioctena quinquepunctata]|nr:hypothetical protein JTB14_033893 [Gonioctena quinquepunctata]